MRNSFLSLAMTDYPYPASFLAPLPAYPVTVSCRILIDMASDVLIGLREAAGLFYNGTSGSLSVRSSSLHGWHTHTHTHTQSTHVRTCMYVCVCVCVCVCQACALCLVLDDFDDPRSFLKKNCLGSLAVMVVVHLHVTMCISCQCMSVTCIHACTG